MGYFEYDRRHMRIFGIEKKWSDTPDYHALTISLFCRVIRALWLVVVVVYYTNCSLYAGLLMMTSSNGNIFRVIGHLYENSPVTGDFPAQRPVTRSFGVFFDLP